MLNKKIFHEICCFHCRKHIYEMPVSKNAWSLLWVWIHNVQCVGVHVCGCVRMCLDVYVCVCVSFLSMCTETEIPIWMNPEKISFHNETGVISDTRVYCIMLFSGQIDNIEPLRILCQLYFAYFFQLKTSIRKWEKCDDAKWHLLFPFIQPQL